jgi:hypothetical protein
VLGVPALSYAALWEGAGGVSRTASIGAVSASTGVVLGGLSAGARTAGLGKLAALQAVTATLDGFTREASFGQPVAYSVRHVDAESVADTPAQLGVAEFYSAVTRDFASVADTAAAFGVPDVGFGLLVEPESVEPRGHTFGSPAYGWRKCLRWDLCAQVLREAELGAEIRPAPVAAQVWRGEGCVRRERTMAAVVARWADLHTVARRRNAMDAAVRRKEQI